jgi:hypothetical protein
MGGPRITALDSKEPSCTLVSPVYQRSSALRVRVRARRTVESVPRTEKPFPFRAARRSDCVTPQRVARQQLGDPSASDDLGAAGAH